MSNDTSYSVCKIEKAKAANNNCAGSLKRRYEHNTRVYTPPNVDTSLSYLNKELMSCNNIRDNLLNKEQSVSVKNRIKAIDEDIAVINKALGRWKEQ